MPAPLVRTLILIGLGVLALACTACGGGDTASDGDSGGGFDDPTFKRYANGSYTLGKGSLTLHYWSWDADDTRYEHHRVTISPASIEIFGQAISGSSTVTRIDNLTDGVVHDEDTDGPLHGYIVNSSVTISGQLQGYLWQLNFDFALGDDIQARYCPWDGQGTIDPISRQLTAGVIGGTSWRNGDADMVGGRLLGIDYKRLGNNSIVPGQVAVPLPNASGDWYQDGGWAGDFSAYLPSIGLDGDPLWGEDFDQLDLELDLDFSSGGDITGTAIFIDLVASSEAGAVDDVFEVDETFTVTGAVRGGMVVLLVASDIDDWSMTITIAPGGPIVADGADIEEATLGAGIAQPNAVWPAGECVVDMTHDSAVVKISN